MTESLTNTEESTTTQPEPSWIKRAAFRIQQGVADAGKAVEATSTTLGRLSSKAVYGTCYGIAYGVTFVALSVSNVLPEVMMRGFKEGVEAAEAIFEPKTDFGEIAEQPS